MRKNFAEIYKSTMLTVIAILVGYYVWSTTLGAKPDVTYRNLQLKNVHPLDIPLVRVVDVDGTVRVEGTVDIDYVRDDIRVEVTNEVQLSEPVRVTTW